MIAGLVLAAGESLRMGEDKALLPYRGRTFLENVVSTLREAGLERIAVVLGHHAEQIQRAVEPQGVRVVINFDYRKGQTSSLQAGLRALESPDLDAVVLSLVDHPQVSPRSVKAVIETFLKAGAPVVVPTFQGRRGHPVLIARALFEELKNLNPQEGANTVIRRYHMRTGFVEVDDPGILLDIDDPETYRRLMS